MRMHVHQWWWIYHTANFKWNWTAYHQDAKNRSSCVVREDENSLELNLKLQYFGHLMQRSDSLEKILMLGKIEDRRRRGKHRVRWSDDINDSMDMNLRKLQQIVKDREAWHAAVHRVAKSRTWLSNWTAAAINWETVLNNSLVLFLVCVLVLFVFLTAGVLRRLQ